MEKEGRGVLILYPSEAAARHGSGSWKAWLQRANDVGEGVGRWRESWQSSTMWWRSERWSGLLVIIKALLASDGVGSRRMVTVGRARRNEHV